MRHMHVAWWELPWRVWQVKREVARHAAWLRLRPELLPVLGWAKRAGVPLAVASSNGHRLIVNFFARHLPDSQFAPILGDLPMFGKQRALRRLGRHRTLIYVGDEVRDVQAAQRSGVACIAVTWDKDSAAVLRAAGLTRLAEDGAALRQHCSDLHLHLSATIDAGASAG